MADFSDHPPIRIGLYLLNTNLTKQFCFIKGFDTDLADVTCSFVRSSINLLKILITDPAHIANNVSSQVVLRINPTQARAECHSWKLMLSNRKTSSLAIGKAGFENLSLKSRSLFNILSEPPNFLVS